MKDLYIEDSIKERFIEYGSIFRHVLPRSVGHPLNIQHQRKNVIVNLFTTALERLAFNGNIEDVKVSHYLVQYEVELDGKMHFVIIK
jgi:hypothetical protein